MKAIKWIFVGLMMIETSCSESDNEISGHNLFETNHTNRLGHLRYSYVSNKVDKITRVVDNVEHAYIKVNYLSDSDLRIKSVDYYFEVPTLQQEDTLIYSFDNLTQIVKTTKENGVIISQDTTNFLYDQLNHLIQANNQSWRKKVEFLEYQDGNFSRTKVYHGSQLQFDISLKYDSKVSPFKKLSYLNPVFFNNNLLEGFEHFTENNIIEFTQHD